MLGVVWFGAINAVLLAVLLALLRFVRIAARPEVSLLGSEADVRGFHALRDYPRAQAPPGLALFRFDGPLAFLNDAYFRDRVLAAADAAGPELRAVVVDATGFSTREDTTGVLMLVELRDQLASRGVEFALAGKRHLIEEWRRKRGLGSGGRLRGPRPRLLSTPPGPAPALAAAPAEGARPAGPLPRRARR